MTPLVSYKTVHSLYNYISITSDIVTGRYHPAIVAFVEGILGMSASRSISDILSQCRESGKESAVSLAIARALDGFGIEH